VLFRIIDRQLFRNRNNQLVIIRPALLRRRLVADRSQRSGNVVVLLKERYSEGRNRQEVYFNDKLVAVVPSTASAVGFGGFSLDPEYNSLNMCFDNIVISTEPRSSTNMSSSGTPTTTTRKVVLSTTFASSGSSSSSSSSPSSSSLSTSSSATTTSLTTLQSTSQTSSNLLSSLAQTEELPQPASNVAIIGGVIGGVVLLLLAMLAIMCVAKRRHDGASDNESSATTLRDQQQPQISVRSVAPNSDYAVLAVSRPSDDYSVCCSFVGFLLLVFY
jgi:hypothetical protein